MGGAPGDVTAVVLVQRCFLCGSLAFSPTLSFSLCQAAKAFNKQFVMVKLVIRSTIK